MRFLRYAATLVTPFLLATTLTAQSLDVQLQRAEQREVATGDHKAAATEYKRIADRAGSNKALGARALLKLAEAYTALGDAQARTVYEQILTKYPDQSAVITTARMRLGATARPVVRQLTRRQIMTDATSRDIGLATMSVSPDGRYLLFPLNNRTQLVVRDLNTGIERVLVRDDASIHIQPLMSPDSKRIVYASGLNTGDAPGNIRIMNSDGRGQRTVLTLPRSEISGLQMLAWSPDATRILIINRMGQGNFRLQWMNTTNGERTPLFDGVSQGDFDVEISPDGRYVALGGVQRVSKREIVVVTSDGTKTTTLSENGNDMMPVGWAPDGRSVIVASRRTTSVGLWAFPVSNGAPSGEPAQVVSDICDCDGFTSYGMTRSGAFYFTATVERSDIYTAMRDPLSGLPTSQPRPINTARNGSNVSPVWADDSHQLLYRWSTGQSPLELLTYSLATGSERRLAGLRLSAGGVCWSGDNGVLIRRRQGDRIQFTRVDLGTRAETVVFDEPSNQMANSTCTPDGRFVAYRDFSGAAIRVRDTRSGTTSELRSPLVNGTGTSIGISAPAISRDGSQVAFLSIVENANRMTAILVAPANGTEARRVTQPRPGNLVFVAPARPVSWSPDGRFLYYSRRDQANAPWELYAVAADTGAEQRVGLTGVDVRDVSVSPDGTQFAFAAGPLRRPEIAVIENFVPQQR